MTVSRMQKRATVWIDGEKIKRVTVYKVNKSRREAMIPLRRLSGVEDFSDAPLRIDVEWSGHEYIGHLQDLDNEIDSLVYVFDRETVEKRYS